MATRCEGWRRRGGTFTLGPVTWEQCDNNAIVNLTVVQEKEETLPACKVCWQEAIDKGITIKSAIPLKEVKSGKK